MIYVALAAIATMPLTVMFFTALMARQQRQHAREREQLLARIMHLAGKTWEIPPSREVAEAEEKFDPDRYSYAPEQEPEA